MFTETFPSVTRSSSARSVSSLERFVLQCAPGRGWSITVVFRRRRDPSQARHDRLAREAPSSARSVRIPKPRWGGGSGILVAMSQWSCLRLPSPSALRCAFSCCNVSGIKEVMQASRSSYSKTRRSRFLGGSDPLQVVSRASMSSRRARVPLPAPIRSASMRNSTHRSLK